MILGLPKKMSKQKCAQESILSGSHGMRSEDLHDLGVT